MKTLLKMERQFKPLLKWHPYTMKGALKFQKDYGKPETFSTKSAKKSKKVIARSPETD